MSDKSTSIIYKLPCPNCGHIDDYPLNNWIEIDNENIVSKILNDQINKCTCSKCNFSFLSKTDVIFVNSHKEYAVYYRAELTSVLDYILMNEKDNGVNNYITNPIEVYTFDDFKKVIKEREINHSRRIRIFKSDFTDEEMHCIRTGNLWSCDACGGDYTTGCMWHDPTECPKFT